MLGLRVGRRRLLPAYCKCGFFRMPTVFLFVLEYAFSVLWEVQWLVGLVAVKVYILWEGK